MFTLSNLLFNWIRLQLSQQKLAKRVQYSNILQLSIAPHTISSISAVLLNKTHNVIVLLLILYAPYKSKRIRWYFALFCFQSITDKFLIEVNKNMHVLSVIHSDQLADIHYVLNSKFIAWISFELAFWIDKVCNV